jgi:hypothetical protein
VSFESKAEPIKLGVLMDWANPDDHPAERIEDFFVPLKIVFEDGRANGLIDRPVELVVRQSWGLPMGTVKGVIDAYGELVDEGCLAVFGPSISENCIPVREEIEKRFKVPALSMSGSDDWLGEWTFSLPQGSLSDEPVFWTDLLTREGHTDVGMLIESSLVGEEYAKNFRKACKRRGIRIVAESYVAQTDGDVLTAVNRLHDSKATAFVHCGFGFGYMQVNKALESIGWDPLRLTGTAFQNAWFHDAVWQATMGWTGVDQYDEGNLVGQKFLDRYEKETGRRPAWVVPLMNHDFANVFLHAFADAHPLSPRGVRDALERIRMLPSAGGAPGTHISFGNYQHRGWMGAGYLVARRLDPDGEHSHLVARFGEV